MVEGRHDWWFEEFCGDEISKEMGIQTKYPVPQCEMVSSSFIWLSGIFYPLCLNWRHTWDVWTINIYVCMYLAGTWWVVPELIPKLRPIQMMGGWQDLIRFEPSSLGTGRGGLPHIIELSKARWCLGFPLWRKMWHVWRAAKESRVLIVNLFLCSKWSNGMLDCLKARNPSNRQ